MQMSLLYNRLYKNYFPLDEEKIKTMNEKDREATEEKMLLLHTDKLPAEWQIALSEWKMKNEIHSLTETRAKRFLKEIEVLN